MVIFEIYIIKLIKELGFTNLMNLKELDLSNQEIEKIENLSNLKNLHVLNLSYNRISKIENVTCLKNLEIFYLSNNFIQEIPTIFTKNTNIVEFYIGFNAILKKDNILNMKHMSKLKVLDLEGNPITNFSDYKNYTLGVLQQLLKLDKKTLDARIVISPKNAQIKNLFTSTSEIQIHSEHEIYDKEPNHQDFHIKQYQVADLSLQTQNNLKKYEDSTQNKDLNSSAVKQYTNKEIIKSNFTHLETENTINYLNINHENSQNDHKNTYGINKQSNMQNRHLYQNQRSNHINLSDAQPCNSLDNCGNENHYQFDLSYNKKKHPDTENKMTVNIETIRKMIDSLEYSREIDPMILNFDQSHSKTGQEFNSNSYQGFSNLKSPNRLSFNTSFTFPNIVNTMGNTANPITALNTSKAITENLLHNQSSMFFFGNKNTIFVDKQDEEFNMNIVLLDQLGIEKTKVNQQLKEILLTSGETKIKVSNQFQVYGEIVSKVNLLR